MEVGQVIQPTSVIARIEAAGILRLWATTSPAALSAPGTERVYCSWSAADARMSVDAYLARIGCTASEKRMLRTWHRREEHGSLPPNDTQAHADLREQVMAEVVSWLVIP
jgi:hypothetical protein